MLLVALAGCDYVLGLDPRGDAGTDSTPNDAPTDDAPADAQRTCFRELFDGAALSSAWQPALNPQITISVDGELHFNIAGMATGATSIATPATFDLTEDVVRADLGGRPPLGTRTSLAIRDVDSNRFELRVPPVGNIDVLVGGVQQTTLEYGTYLEIAFRGAQVRFRTSLNGENYVEHATVLGKPATGLHLHLGMNVVNAQATAGKITWRSIEANCP